MTAQEIAIKAIRATHEVESARAEVERLAYLVEQEADLIRQCVKDCEQPKWVARTCTRTRGPQPERTFRCGCRKCNESATWQDWFNTEEYYTILFRQTRLEDELEEAQATLKDAVSGAKALTKEARRLARVEMGLDE